MSKAFGVPGANQRALQGAQTRQAMAQLEPGYVDPDKVQQAKSAAQDMMDDPNNVMTPEEIADRVSKTSGVSIDQLIPTETIPTSSRGIRQSMDNLGTTPEAVFEGALDSSTSKPSWYERIMNPLSNLTTPMFGNPAQKYTEGGQSLHMQEMAQQLVDEGRARNLDDAMNILRLGQRGFNR